jgi:hypothetical protein
VDVKVVADGWRAGSGKEVKLDDSDDDVVEREDEDEDEGRESKVGRTRCRVWWLN